MYDIVLTGGTIVTGAEARPGAIAIANGRIAAILGKDARPEATRIIDVSGKLVMPGAIDAHVHIKTVYSPAADTIESATIAAAHGGITSVFVFIGVSRGSKPMPGAIYRAIDASGIKAEEFFPPIIAEGEKSSVVDFGIHCLLPPDREFIDQIPQVAKLGITSYKMMLGYHPARGWTIGDHLMMTVLEMIAAGGGIAMFHCENGDVIGHLEDRLAAAGKYDAGHFLESRPNVLEAETLHRMAVLTRLAHCPMYVVHLSTKEGLHELIQARAGGSTITAETCPQYLLLTDDDTRRQKNLLKMAPPLRSKADNEALWQGIKDGHINIVASDHAPWKRDSQKLAARDFGAAPFGAPGVETLLPLMYSEGVAKGRISAIRLVQLMCENPAKKLGIYPRKGSLNASADADIVVIDPATRWTIRGQDLHSRAGYTGYEGWEVSGKPVMSFLRGRMLLEDGQLHPARTTGKYLHRPS